MTNKTIDPPIKYSPSLNPNIETPVKVLAKRNKRKINILKIILKVISVYFRIYGLITL